MFDEPPSLPMRAAIASLLGSLFGIALILFTNSADAQTAATPTDAAPLVALPDSQLRRLGETALRALRGAEPLYSLGNVGTRAMRLNDNPGDPASGLRWQVVHLQGWSSQGDIPRGHDLISVGMQVRF